MSNSDELFIAKVRNSSQSDLRKRRKVVGDPWQVRLLKGLTWLLAGSGLLLALTVFIVMESVYAQLGSLADVEFAASLEATPEIEELMRTIGIDWFPEFLKLYSIRFAIVLGILGLFACLSIATFALSRSVRTKK